MSKKRNNENSMICFTQKPNQSFFVYHIQSKEKLLFFFLQKKSFLRKNESVGWNKQKKTKTKRMLFNCFCCSDEEGPPTTSIRKQVNKLKVHEKTVRTAIKQDSCPDLNFFDYSIRVVLENKRNAISHPNIGSLKTAIGEEWNKMSQEFNLKAWKSFRRRFDTIIKKNVDYIE